MLRNLLRVSAPVFRGVFPSAARRLLSNVSTTGYIHSPGIVADPYFKKSSASDKILSNLKTVHTVYINMRMEQPEMKPSTLEALGSQIHNDVMTALRHEKLNDLRRLCTEQMYTIFKGLVKKGLASQAASFWDGASNPTPSLVRARTVRIKGTQPPLVFYQVHLRFVTPKGEEEVWVLEMKRGQIAEHRGDWRQLWKLCNISRAPPATK